MLLTSALSCTWCREPGSILQGAAQSLRGKAGEWGRERKGKLEDKEEVRKRRAMEREQKS